MDPEQTAVEGERTEADGAATFPDDPADRYGRYRVTGRLGAGGMGVVYEGVDELLDREVAIKVILGRKSKGRDDPRARLLREARALAALSHPNVVEVYEVGARGVDVFVVMERIRGKTLAAWLEKPRPWREVVSVLVAAGHGLLAAHEAGLVHRDFKPTNAIIGDSDGRVRVLDFGLVWVDDPTRLSSTPDVASQDDSESEADDVDRLTRAGVVMGTPAYMSPEQLGGAPIGPTTDQWAFCVTLFEGVFGRRPFAGRSIEELVVRTAKTPPPRPRLPAAPTWLWRAIERGLARDPSDRWPSLRELLDELERRSQRRGSLAWGLVPIAIVGATIGLVLGDDEPRSCEDGAERIGKIWHPEARARMLALFDEATSIDAGNHLAAELDEAAAEWSAAFASVCAARGGTSPWPEETLDRAAACLGDSERRIAMVVAAFDGTDPRAVYRAGDLLDELRSPARCADAGALAEQIDPPTDPTIAADVEEIRRRIAWIDTLVVLDRVDEAIAPARAALHDAEATGYVPLVAEASFALGDVLSRTNDAAEAIDRTTDAYWTAYGVRHHDVAAAAGSLLVHEIGRKGAFDEALDWARRTRAIVERTAATRELVPALDRREAHVLMRLGRYDEADALVVASLAVLEAEQDVRPGEIAWSLSQRGSIARNRGDSQQAIAWLARAASTLEAAYGAHHSQVGAVLVNLGLAHLEADEVEAAREVLLRAVAINEKVLGADHRELAPGLMALAHAELRSGNTSEATAMFERARRINAAQWGDDSINAAYAIEGLARVAAAEGRHEDAVAYYEQVVAIRVPGSIAPTWRAQALFGLAEELVAVDRDRDRARALAEEAAALFAEARGADSRDARRARAWVDEHP